MRSLQRGHGTYYGDRTEMTDAIDQGCQREQEDRERALAVQAAKPAMPFIGSCYNCEALIDRGCFCDRDCRDDFERHTRAKQLNK